MMWSNAFFDKYVAYRMSEFSAAAIPGPERRTAKRELGRDVGRDRRNSKRSRAVC